MTFWLRIFALCSTVIFSIVFGAGVVPASAQEAVSPVRIATAMRGDTSPPHIDGRLDDVVWQNAPLFTDFLQHDPIEGDAATEKTTFQIAYGEEALYVGIRCYDSEADKIVSRLTRRDGETEADWISVSLDPRLDRQTGCWFTVYASGSVSDGVYSNDDHRDRAWDGVWEVETTIDAEGWSAEYRIPYHVLRFSPKEEYVWGLNVERHISRKQERDHWSLIRKGPARPGVQFWTSAGDS